MWGLLDLPELRIRTRLWLLNQDAPQNRQNEWRNFLGIGVRVLLLISRASAMYCLVRTPLASTEAIWKRSRMSRAAIFRISFLCRFLRFAVQWRDFRTSSTFSISMSHLMTDGQGFLKNARSTHPKKGNWQDYPTRVTRLIPVGLRNLLRWCSSANMVSKDHRRQHCGLSPRRTASSKSGQFADTRVQIPVGAPFLRL